MFGLSFLSAKGLAAGFGVGLFLLGTYNVGEARGWWDGDSHGSHHQYEQSGDTGMCS